MKIHNGNHPIWALLKLIVIMAALTLSLKWNASNFDATELRTIISMFFVFAGLETGQQVVNRVLGKEKPADKP